MKKTQVLRSLALLGAGVALAAVLAPASQAQISINIGAQPACPYGYYDYAPYACAPYGYYGPQWFSGGLFIGAGPWFHGPANFRGQVNNRLDPKRGYHGAVPHAGDRPAAGKRPGKVTSFRGNEARDGRGHVVAAGHR